MGYLDNSSITVDAILTKKGRELLSRNDGSFNITSFALGDDEIDYSLFNENHPDGSQFAGQAIENMPILEAFPDENNIMRHKLITLNQGVTRIPIISLSSIALNLNKSEDAFISPSTLNYDGANDNIEPSGYMFTVKDRRLFSNFIGSGIGSAQSGEAKTVTNTTAVSETVTGTSLNLKALSSETLFGSNTKLVTIITIEGLDTGAKATVSVTINKTNQGGGQYQPGDSQYEA